MWLHGFRGIPGMQQHVQLTAPNTSCALIIHRSTEGQWNVWRFSRIHVKECSSCRCRLAKEQYALHRTCFSLSATKISPHTHSTFKFLGRDKIRPCVCVSKGLWAKPARAFTYKSHTHLGHHSLLAFRASVLQSFSLTAQQPALLVYAQLDKGWEWKASPSCSICDWKNTMEELFSQWHGAVPTGSTTLGLLTEAGAVCLPRALHSARIKLQCHVINRHVFGSDGTFTPRLHSSQYLCVSTHSASALLHSLFQERLSPSQVQKGSIGYIY